jgi:hypothetical protein
MNQGKISAKGQNLGSDRGGWQSRTPRCLLDLRLPSPVFFEAWRTSDVPFVPSYFCLEMESHKSNKYNKLCLCQHFYANYSTLAAKTLPPFYYKRGK